MNKRDAERLIRRTRDRLALVGEHTSVEIEEVVAGVICNGCGKVEFARAVTKTALFEALPHVFVGWTITPGADDADFCPSCTTAKAWAA